MNHVSTDRVARQLASVERFFSQDVERFKRHLTELDHQIDPQAEPRRHDPFHRRVLEAFAESQEACARFEAEFGDDPVVIRDVQHGFRQETSPWFDRSWIAHRARTKPSGFSGDFEMLNKLYDEATPARGLGGYLDLCILDLPLARAVRARRTAVRNFVISEVGGRSGLVRVLDVACGPCREFVDWPEESIRGQLEVVAMDNDPKALEYLAAEVAPSLPDKMTLQATRYNALRMRSADATSRRFGKFDIIYSVGLFDYLPDEPLIAILTALRETLTEDGVLLVAFKDTVRYDKTPYQWHLDWFFFQRTEADCLRLYDRAGIRESTTIADRDETGIIMHFVTRRATQSFLRTHMPESLPAWSKGHLPQSLNVALGE